MFEYAPEQVTGVHTLHTCGVSAFERHTVAVQSTGGTESSTLRNHCVARKGRCRAQTSIKIFIPV